MTGREALAEAWASIDGKLDAFRRERDDRTLDHNSSGYTGHYEGYMEEAAELLRRLYVRGFTIEPMKCECLHEPQKGADNATTTTAETAISVDVPRPGQGR